MAAFPFDLTVIVRRQEAAASMANVSHQAVKYQVNRGAISFTALTLQEGERAQLVLLG